MIKISKISIAGFCIGILVMALSIQRWWITYYTLSKFAFGISLGAIIMLFSYFYNWAKEQERQNTKFEERLDAIASWWTKNEKETIHEIAMGEKA